MTDDANDGGNLLANLTGNIRSVRQLIDELTSLRKSMEESNLFSVLRKAMELAKKRGVQLSTEHVSRSAVVSLIEGASAEDDDEIQDLWAGLMYKAFDLRTRQNPRRVFKDILRSIEPIDAAILRFVNKKYDNGSCVPMATLLNDMESARGLSLTIFELRLSLLNLARLGCINYSKAEGIAIAVQISEPDTAHTVIKGEDSEVFKITGITLLLMEACDEIKSSAHGQDETV